MRETGRTLRLGTVFATANALDRVPATDITAALERHERCDWGNLQEEDRLANEEALAVGGGILSAYETSGGERFWIVTERDRSCTTILLPEDY